MAKDRQGSGPRGGRDDGPAAASSPAVTDPSPPGADTRAARQAERQAQRQIARKAERQAERAARQAQRGAERDAARAERAAKAAQARPRSDAPSEGTSLNDTPRGDAPREARPQPPAWPAAPAEPTALAGPAAPEGPVGPAQDFDILVVAQGGGIDRDAAILAASLRRNAPGFAGRLVVAEPQPGRAWAGHDPRMSDAARAALGRLGADIRPLHARDFGASYPHGNKIEALGLLDPDRPFLFLDSDTLVLGDLARVPFDFARPTASMRRSGTWPVPPEYRHSYDSIWRSLYQRFGLDMDGTLDLSQPEDHWERFLYFNAGWFCGADAAVFGKRFRDWAVAVRDDPGEALACQSLDPWLDQVVLPLVVHSLGGGRPDPRLSGMDGDVTCHWRRLPLLYARESQRAVTEMEAIAALPELADVVGGWPAGQRLIAGGEGRARIRPMFAAARPLPPERAIRHQLRQAGLWLS